ncbi:MAG: hypothetical protein QM820_15160 [Minicystis sp.]
MSLICRVVSAAVVIASLTVFSIAGCSSGGSGPCFDACKATASCAGVTINGDIESACTTSCDVHEEKDLAKMCTTQHEAFFNCQITNKCDYRTKCAAQADAYDKCAQ